jgi:hypothetical protein
MGQFNSSFTRVQPIFVALRTQDPTGVSWLPELWRIATGSRQIDPLPPPTSGPLLPGAGFERVVPPSVAFLRWAIRNPDRLTTLPAPDYGATGEVSKEKRAALFGSDGALRARVMAEALAAIESSTAAGSAQQWWAFEGFTHVDACFETAEAVVFIEGKRTESVSPSTRWFRHRNQLWRNVEVAGELARGRAFGVILCVENVESGLGALADAEAAREASLPHLSESQRAELDRHLLGYVAWSEIVERFALPASVMLKTWEPRGEGPS